MPPKADVVPEKQKDVNPVGVFINVTLKSYALQLELAAAAPAAAKGSKGAPVVTDGPVHLPRMHLSLDYSNVYAAVSGEQSVPEPAELAAPPASGEKATVDCSYEGKGAIAFRIDESPPALSQLINTKILLRVHASDAAGAPVIATAALDMLPFACGKGQFDLEKVPLVPIDVPPGAPKLLSGSLAGLGVHLTVKRKPESDGPESDVPEAFFFITPQDIKDGANVIEVEIAGLQPLPSGLQAAVDLVCGKDGLQGKVKFMAGLSLPVPVPPIAIQGRISSGQVIFDGPIRFPLSADGAEVLRSHLEAGNLLTVEIARYVTCADSLVDNAWHSYHGLAKIQNSLDLIKEECKILLCESSEVMPWQVDGQSCLESCVEKPSGGKAKPIEPEAESYGPSAWSNSLLCNFKMSLLVSPLVPQWQAPPALSKSIVDLIPPRDLNPAPPPLDPSGDFKVQVQAALKALGQAYQEHGTSEKSKSHMFTSVPQKHKSLIFDLNRSGTYVNLRESFKPSIERIVREHQAGRDIISQPDEMVPHYSPLYQTLMDLVHLEISSVGHTAPQPKPPQPLTADQSSRFLELAFEYEDHGLWLLRSNASTSPVKSQELLKRANDLHRKRLIDSNNAQTWVDAASFSLRSGDLSSGTSALRSALEIDPASKEALIKMSLSSLELLISSQGDKTGHFETSLAAAYALVGLSNEDDEALSWALLALVFSQDPTLPGASRQNLAWMQCRQRLSTLERSALASGQSSPESSNGFFQLWATARAIKLPLVSKEIHALVPVLQQSSKALEIRSACASLETSFLLLGSASTEGLVGLVSATKKMARRLPSTCTSDLYTTFMIQADVYQRMGLLDESILSLQKAKGYASDKRIYLATLLRLADAYLLLSDTKLSSYASETLLSAAAEDVRVRQSPLCWCLVGASRLEDGDLASKAFKESNALDPEFSSAWMYLALIESRSQRWNETSSALARLFQLGAFGDDCLALIAAQYESAGRWRQAADILEKALSIQENEDTKRRLVQAHLILKNSRKALEIASQTNDAQFVDQALSLPVDEV